MKVEKWKFSWEGGYIPMLYLPEEQPLSQFIEETLFTFWGLVPLDKSWASHYHETKNTIEALYKNELFSVEIDKISRKITISDK